MTKVQFRHAFGAISLLAFSAACSDAGEPAPVGEKVAIPSDQVFEFSPEGAESADSTTPKSVREQALTGKGSVSLPFGNTYTQAVTIAPGQTVSFSTSGATSSVDPVLVLFHRFDNSTNFATYPYTDRVGIQTLAINDDTVGYNSAISYTNNTGTTLNARLMAFAYYNRVGQVVLNGVGTIPIAAGSIKDAGNAGNAWTSGSVSPVANPADPWLFMFDVTPGQGNGVWNDDDPAGGRESIITGSTSNIMWYVAHGWHDGTTTVNY